jgi:hypothetical protein
MEKQSEVSKSTRASNEVSKREWISSLTRLAKYWNERVSWYERIGWYQ